MRKSALAALFGLSLAATSPAFGGTCPSGAPSATVYATGFEKPPFAAGSQLVGQDGWVGVNSIPGTSCQANCLSPLAAVIAPNLYFAGQSVRVRGQDLVHQAFINALTGGYYAAIGSYRKPVTCDVAAAFPLVHVEAKVRLDGPKTPPGADAHACVKGRHHPCNNFFSVSITARAARTGSPENPTAGIGELAISSDGKAYGYSGDDNVPTFLASRPVKLGEWHTLVIHTDLVNRKLAFCVDGKLLPGSPFSLPPTANTNTLARGSLVVYAAPDTPQLKKRNYQAYYDNFLIITLPASHPFLHCDI